MIRYNLYYLDLATGKEKEIPLSNVANAKLDKEIAKVDLLDFSLFGYPVTAYPIDNPHRIKLFRNGECCFVGTMESVERDIYSNLKYKCVGLMNLWFKTVYPPAMDRYNSPREYKYQRHALFELMNHFNKNNLTETLALDCKWKDKNELNVDEINWTGEYSEEAPKGRPNKNDTDHAAKYRQSCMDASEYISYRDILSTKVNRNRANQDNAIEGEISLEETVMKNWYMDYGRPVSTLCAYADLYNPDNTANTNLFASLKQAISEKNLHSLRILDDNSEYYNSIVPLGMKYSELPAGAIEGNDNRLNIKVNSFNWNSKTPPCPRNIDFTVISDRNLKEFNDQAYWIMQDLMIQKHPAFKNQIKERWKQIWEWGKAKTYYAYDLGDDDGHPSYHNDYFYFWGMEQTTGTSANGEWALVENQSVPEKILSSSSTTLSSINEELQVDWDHGYQTQPFDDYFLPYILACVNWDLQPFEFVENYDEVKKKGRRQIVKVYDKVWKRNASESGNLPNLEDEAFKELNAMNRLRKSYEIEAVDLSAIEEGLDSFDIGRSIKVDLPDYGINDVLPITSLSVDILNPSSNTLTLGRSIPNLTDQVNAKM